MKRAWLLVTLILMLASAAGAGTEAEVSQLEREVDALMKPLVDEDLISGSVLIARGGRIALAKGYGPANREYDAPCTPRTKYRLASMTKSFTAAAVMILQERGLLSVEDPLDKYIPDYPRGSEIKLSHLLSHTSGIVNYSALPDHYDSWTVPHSIDEVIARFRDEPLGFDPGERWGYSNSGYVLLTHIVEKVGGMPYGEFLEQNIFAPLGMEDTGVDSHTQVIRGRATGHYNLGDGIVQAPYLYIEFTSGAGSLYSTVLDLYEWDRALYTDRILSTASREQMFTVVRANYGYGWFVREAFGRKLIEHRGGINGFLTMIQRFVDDDVLIVTLFNYVSTFSREVNRGLAAIALGEEHRPVLLPQGVEVEAARLGDLVGAYRLGNSILRVTLEDGRLWTEDPDGERSQAIPQSDERFFLRDSNAVLNFVRGDGGRVERMIVQQSEHTIPCPRIEEPPAGGS